MVVFVTVVVMGGLTPFVMKRLGLDGPSTNEEHGKTETKTLHVADSHETMSPAKSSRIDGVTDTEEESSEGHHHKKKASLTTLDEYMPRSTTDVNEVSQFADAFSSGYD